MGVPAPRTFRSTLAVCLVCVSGLLLSSPALAGTESAVECLSYHILVEQQDEADWIYSLLMSTPSSERLERFKQIARTRSKDPGSGSRGGELGWANPDAFVKPFADTLMRLQVGEYSTPVQTQFGWHIVYLADRRVVQRDAALTGREQVGEIVDRGLTMLSPQWSVLSAYSETDNPYVVYIHSATSVADDKTRNGWLLFTYSQPRPATPDTANRPYRSVRQQFAADCKRRAIGTRQYIAYSKEFGSGEVVSGQSRTPDLVEVAPDTLGETILTEVCGRKLK